MKNLILALMLSAFLFSCHKGDHNSGNNYKGFIYTSTNSSTGNAIVALGRNNDGTLTELPGSPYPTGALGDAGDGDFDTQYALTIWGDYLLAVNAGANPTNGSVSVFKIDKSNGSLTQVDQNSATPAMDNMDSRGVRAVSIAATSKNDHTWIIVANQFGNPNYQGDPAVAFGFPIVTTDMRNLAVFSFNTTTGILEFNKIGATYPEGTYGGPTNVAFNTAGTKVAVSTWGVTHFLTPNPDLSLQKPGRLYIYDFIEGTLSESGMYEETGVSGNIGLSWSPDQQYIYLANFNLHSSKQDHSLTVHDATTAAKVQNFATGNTDDDEACWTHVSNDNKRLYVASFTANIVSAFDINADNKLTVSLSPNFFTRTGVPMPDTKDMYEASGYLYVSGAFQSHSVSIFSIGADGKLTEKSGSPYHVPSSAGKTKDEQSFLGLAGFEK